MIIKPTSLICALPDSAQNELICELNNELNKKGFSTKKISHIMEDIYSHKLSYVESFVDINKYCDFVTVK